MYIVVDTCAFAKTLQPENKEHAEYKPVKDWIDARKGKIVFGGSKYKSELEGRAIRLLRLMRDSGMAVAIEDAVVDANEAAIKKALKATKCDDQHIIALLGSSGCILLCSSDKRSFSFVKDRSLYPKGMGRVRVYTSSKNAKLLSLIPAVTLRNIT